LADCHVGLVGIRGDGAVNASAAVCSAFILTLTDWYAEMTAFCLVTWFLRSVCGCAATCMSCAITCVVFMPLTRPSTVVELDTEFPPATGKSSPGSVEGIDICPSGGRPGSPTARRRAIQLS